MLETSNTKNEQIKSLSIDGSSKTKQFVYTILSKTDEGITKPQYILFDNTTAFKKDSRMIDDSDDMEMVINWIGRKLGIEMAESYQVLSSSNEPVALISVNVAKTADETFISMDKVREKIITSVKIGERPYEIWMKRYAALLGQKAYPSVAEAFESIANNERETREIVEFGEKLIDLISTASIETSSLKKNYRKMIFLDALIGQVDRTLGNYGLVYNAKTDSYRFAPLFDNATLRKPYTDYGICLVNGFVATRTLVLKIIIEDDEIFSLAKSLIQNRFELVSALLKIAAEWLKPNQYDLLMSNILTGILALEELTMLKERD